MEVHIYSVKAKIQHMCQKYNSNTKLPKPQDTQLEILKMYTFCRKVQQRASGPGESTA